MVSAAFFPHLVSRMSDLSQPNLVMATLGWLDLTCLTMSAYGLYWLGEGCIFVMVGGRNLSVALGMEEHFEDLNVEDIILAPMSSAW